MGLKSFLRPDWRKLVLPAVFIVMFLIVLNAFYSFGSVMDKYGCELETLREQSNSYNEMNNTILYNQTKERMLSLLYDQTKNMQSIVNPPVPQALSLVMAINPIVPLPCELTLNPSVCEFYESQKTFNCTNVQPKTSGRLDISGLFADNVQTYRRASILLPALNILLLFAEGYLISCAAIFGYDKIRSRKQKKPKTEIKKLIPAPSGYRKNSNT